MRACSFAVAVVLSIATGFASADDGFWLGSGGHHDWSESSNWQDEIVADGADHTAYFTNDISSQDIAVLDSDRVIGHLVFSDGGTDGTQRSLRDSGSKLTLSAPSSTPTITVLTYTNLSASLVGSQGFVKTGGDTLRMIEAEDSGLSGDVHVTDGVIMLDGSALGNNITLLLDAGTDAYFLESETFGGLAGPGRITLSSGVSRISVGAGNQTTVFSGEIRDTYPAVSELRKVGTGTLTLSGDSGHRGGTTIQDGTLRATGADERLRDECGVQVGAAGRFHVDGYTETIGTLTGTGVTEVSGTLRVGNGDATFTYEGSFDGIGEVVKCGDGTATLAGDSTGFDGSFSVVDGTLSVSVDNVFGSADVQVDGGRLEVTGGESDCSGLVVGDTGSGALSVTSNGTFFTIGSIGYVGKEEGSAGSISLTGGTLFADLHFRFGYAGTATCEHSGGQFRVDGVMDMAHEPTAVATYNLSSNGELIGEQEWVVIGYMGDATLNQTGGSVAASDKLYIAERSGSVGLYNLEDGTASAVTLTVGYYGDGTLKQTGGTVTCSHVYVGRGSSSTGLYEAFGGVASLGIVEVKSSGKITVGPDASVTGSSYEQAGGGELEILFEGSGSKSQGTLAVSGAADLDGELRVTHGDGFTWQHGDEFVVLTAGSISGTFDVLSGSSDFEVVYDTDRVIVRAVCMEGDLDCDGDVDGEDFAIFEGCLGGPGVAVLDDCEATDLEGDGDVDLIDFGRFQQVFVSAAK